MEEESLEPVIRDAVTCPKKEDKFLVPVSRDAVTNTVHEK